MSKFIRTSLLFSCFLMGCANSGTLNVRTPQTFELTISPSHANAEIWHQASQNIASEIPAYTLHIKDPARDPSVFHTIQSENGQTHVCFAPRTVVDPAGNMTSIFPMHCAELTETQAQQSLTKALDDAQNQSINLTDIEDSAAFRAEVLAKSSPENPLCFSIYPAIFAADTYDLSPALEEAYLIACADRITSDTPDTWQKKVSARLATWLHVEAALLSNQNTFIARAFKAIAQDGTQEGMIYGQAIEAYTEFMAQKTRQTEITAQNALKASDHAGFLMLSRQTAMRLSYIVALAETMDGERMESIVRTLSPASTWPEKMIAYRHWLQIKACQTAIIIPDISPSLVSACLPWLQASAADGDELEMALLLIEHGIYGAKSDDPAISDDVLMWLKAIPKTEETEPILREFALRNQNHARLTQDQRQALQTLAIPPTSLPQN